MAHTNVAWRPTALKKPERISVTFLLGICPRTREQEWVRMLHKETAFSVHSWYILRGKNLPWHGILPSSNSAWLEPVFINKLFQVNFRIWTHDECLQNPIRPYSDSKDQKQVIPELTATGKEQRTVIRLQCQVAMPPLSLLNRQHLWTATLNRLSTPDFLSFFLTQFLDIFLWRKPEKDRKWQPLTDSL